MKIDLPINDLLTRSFRTVVSAEIVDVAPHLAGVATFAVHKCPWSPSPWDWKVWKVTNVETGAFIESGYYHYTQAEAIASAVAALAERTPDDILDHYAKLPKWVRK